MPLLIVLFSLPLAVSGLLVLGVLPATYWLASVPAPAFMVTLTTMLIRVRDRARSAREGRLDQQAHDAADRSIVLWGLGMFSSIMTPAATIGGVAVVG